MLAPWNLEAPVKDHRPCWQFVAVRLNGHHSFFAEVKTLVAMIEEQHNAGAAAFHILFVDGGLFKLLIKDESLHWQDAIKGYLRYIAGKVVQITYSVRFTAEFLQSI
jgi:hypothetical protein